MVISISSIEEEAVGTITIEVGEEVEVLAISHLIQFNSLFFNRNNPIPLLQVQDQKDHLAKSMVNLDT